MSFSELLFMAKKGSADATAEILEMYKPLLMKNAVLSGSFDEDLYQELCITLLKCIVYFKI